MIKLTLTTLAVLATLASSAWANPVKRYVHQHEATAKLVELKTGFPSTVLLAQSAWESGHGRSTLAVKHNAYFGIKADKRWAGKKVKIKGDWYRVYDDAYASFADYAAFILTQKRYKFAVTVKRVPKTYFRQVAAAGYCPCPAYASGIISVFERQKKYVSM